MHPKSTFSMPSNHTVADAHGGGCGCQGGALSGCGPALERVNELPRVEVPVERAFEGTAAAVECVGASTLLVLLLDAAAVAGTDGVVPLSGAELEVAHLTGALTAVSTLGSGTTGAGGAAPTGAKPAIFQDRVRLRKTNLSTKSPVQ